MRCLITGISGFVGDYLSSYLKTKNFDVSGFDIGNNLTEDDNFYCINILDRKRVFNIISKIEPDNIFHLAGFSSVKRSFNQPDLTKSINVDGTKNLLDAIQYCQINPRILVVSSAEIYGKPQYSPIDEKHPLNPISPYAESRLEQEKLCDNYDLDIVISRSFNHIGPKQQPIFVCSSLAKQIAEIEAGVKDPTISVGNLLTKRDFTDVRDMVTAYELALKKCDSGETYNLCSGNSFTISAILHMLLELSDLKIRIYHDPNKNRSSDIAILQGNNAKFRDATSWKPTIHIKQTLNDILSYWRERI